MGNMVFFNRPNNLVMNTLEVPCVQQQFSIKRNAHKLDVWKFSYSGILAISSNSCYPKFIVALFSWDKLVISSSFSFSPTYSKFPPLGSTLRSSMFCYSLASSTSSIACSWSLMLLREYATCSRSWLSSTSLPPIAWSPSWVVLSIKGLRTTFCNIERHCQCILH